MPGWVDAATTEYTQRMPPHCAVLVKGVPAEKRTKHVDLQRIRQLEGEKLLAAIPAGSWVVALDGQGQAWSTEQLAAQLAKWLAAGRDVALLVGGPEGLAEVCRQRADAVWSLSSLTFPHPLVRVIVAEQLFRAWSILANHPYHRGE